MQHGIYDKRRNRAEADYIAQLVRELLRRECGRSIGIVAFSEAQQDEIEGALQRLAQDDADFRDRLDAEWEREIDGQFVGLLVKNLENIQGDERDIVILSVCYGYGPNGKMLMNFGPINKSGGERRLNVAFSRAKHHMADRQLDPVRRHHQRLQRRRQLPQELSALCGSRLDRQPRSLPARAARHFPLAGHARRPERRARRPACRADRRGLAEQGVSCRSGRGPVAFPLRSGRAS